MEEINLKELFDYFRERLVTLLSIVLAVLVIGGIYSIFIKTPMYQSTSTLLLASQNAINTNDITLNKSLLPTYKELAKNGDTVKQVVENLSLDCSVSNLQGRISVDSIQDSLLLKVSVSDKDPETAATITNELAKVLSDQIIDKLSIQNVKIIEEGQVPTKAYNVNIAKDILIYVAVGAVLALAIIFIQFYFDNTIKSSDEIEQKLGLPIFGVVPKVKSNGKK